MPGEYDGLTTEELVAETEARSLDPSGTDADRIKRLEANPTAPTNEGPPPPPPPVPGTVVTIGSEE